MVAVTEFQSDYEFYEYQNDANDELDLSFLEAIESAENIFGIDKEFFSSLSSLKPQKSFIPTLQESVFEEPIEHAVWASNWPNSSRHFPA